MNRKKVCNKWAWRVCLTAALLLAATTGWTAAETITTTTTTGQVALAEGDSLAVQNGGTVAVSTEDEDAIGVKGDGTTESSPCDQPPANPDWFLNDNMVTIDAGGMIDVAAVGTAAYGGTEIFARGLIPLDGNTITNNGTISASAKHEADDGNTSTRAWAFGMQTADSGVNNITNNGLIQVTAQGLSGGGLSYSSANARAAGIQVGHAGEGTVVNTGTIDVEATSVDGLARSLGIKLNYESNVDVTNSGMVDVYGYSENTDAISVGVKGTYRSGGSIINKAGGLITVLTESGGGEAVAKGIQLGDDNGADKGYLVSNNGVIQAVATSTAVGEQVNAMGIHTGDIENSDTSVTNTGTICTTATGVDGYINSFGIKGGAAADTITNSGLIQTRAYSEGEDDTTSIGGKSFGIFSNDDGDRITNSGTIDSYVNASTGVLGKGAMSAAIRAGCADDWSTPNDITNQAGGVLRAYGDWDFADGSSYRSAAHGIWTGDYSRVYNYGQIEVGGNMKSAANVYYNVGFFGVRGADYGFINNTGSIEVTGEINAGGLIEENSGLFGVRSGHESEVNNEGTIDVSGTLTSTDYDQNSGFYGIRLGRDSQVDNSGLIKVNGTLTALGELEENSGAFGIRTGYDHYGITNSGEIDVTLVADVATAEYTHNKTGAYGIRTGYGYDYGYDIVNTGSIAATFTNLTENDSPFDGAYGIRVGHGDAVVVNTGDITTTVTDDSTHGYSMGIWMGDDGNTVHQSGTITASGDKAASVALGCGNSNVTTDNNTLNVMNGADMSGDLLNLSYRDAGDGNHGLATVNFGLAAGTSGKAMAGTPDDDFDFVFTDNIWGFYDIDDSGEIEAGEENYWNANFVGGTTRLNGTKNWLDEAEIYPGATLGGTGNLTVASGLTNKGWIAPGNSIGTLTIDGDYTQSNTGGLAIEVDSSSIDKLDVTGTATIKGGTLDVTTLGYPAASTTAAFLDAATIEDEYGADDGDFFAELTDSSLLLDFEVVYDDTEESLALAVTQMPIAGYTLTDNQRSMASAIDKAGAISGGSGVLDLLAQASNAEELGAMLDQLSPEPYTAFARIGLGNTRAFQGTVLNQVGGQATARRHQDRFAATLAADGPGPDSQASGQALWGELYGSWAEQDKVRDGAGVKYGYDLDTYGLAAGYDLPLSDRMIAGVTAGFGQSEIDFSGLDAKTDVDTFTLGAYSTYSRDKYYAEGLVSASYSEFDTERRITAAGTTAAADYNGGDAALRLGGGYHAVQGPNWTLGPIASLQYAYLWHEDFTESGAGEFNNDLDSGSYDSLLSRVGVAFNGAVPAGNMTLRPKMTLEWGHEYMDEEADITARFNYADAEWFKVDGAESGRNSLLVGAGVEAQLSDSLMLYLNYNGDYRHDFEAEAVTGGVQLAF